MEESFFKFYWAGVIFLIVFYVISVWVIKKSGNGNKWNPFSLARLENKADGFSASRVQVIIFTMLTVFAYATVFAARTFGTKYDGGLLATFGVGGEWLAVPTNLLILMGISVTTAVASAAIKENKGVTPENDLSTATKDEAGKTDLVKIQMLVWTVVAVCVYIYILFVFMQSGCYVNEGAPCLKEWGNSLPDIDTAFLALLGVSQAGHVANQFSKKSEGVEKAPGGDNQPKG